VQRAHQVLGEAVDLLDRMVDDGMLNAIGDGTFGLMRRPADAGRGLDGVVRQGNGYYNPASEILAEGLSRATTAKGGPR